MTFDWYKLFLLSDFEATELVSQNLTVFLEGIGQADILITKGNLTAITYDGVFLPILFDNKNPYRLEGYAVYIDAQGYVWLGVEVPE